MRKRSNAPAFMQECSGRTATRFFAAFMSVALMLTMFSFQVVENTVNAVEAGNSFEDDSLAEYHIKSAQDLLDFGSSKLDFQGKTVYLDADIDMEGIEWKPRDFYGCFDGQYHVIDNLSVQDNDKYYDTFTGLFSQNYGVICRVNLTDFSAATVSGYHGELFEAGQTPRSGYIYQESGGSFIPEGSVICVYNGKGYAGGICACNNGFIYGCSADGNASVSTSYKNCSSMPSTYGHYQGEYTGDICAYNSGEILYCTANGEICDSGSKNGAAKCEPEYHWTQADVDDVMQEQNLSEIGRLTVSDDSIRTFKGMSESVETKINNNAVNANFYSEDNTIAYADSQYCAQGVFNVRGVSAGDTKIKVTSGNQVQYIDVHVSEMGELTVTPDSIELLEGESQTIRAMVDGEPVNAYYSVSDTKIATVDNKTVTAKSCGETEIKVSFGGQVKNIPVRVYGNITKIPANDFSDKNAEEYRITTAEGLIAFAEACKSNGLSDKTVYLDADLDMTDKGYVAPKSFSGTFDGRYHKITGLTANVSYRDISLSQYSGRGRSSCAVYGGALVNNNYGTIIRLSLAKLDISATSWLYAEVNAEGDLVTACYISAYAGGICGTNSGVICGCTTQGVASEYSDSSPANWLSRYDEAKVYGISGDGYEGEYCNSDLKSNEPLSERERAMVDEAFPSKYLLDYVDGIKGDVSGDGEFNVSDVVLLQKWLLAVPNTHLENWKAADLYKDNRLDVFDLCLMKRALINA